MANRPRVRLMAAGLGLALVLGVVAPSSAWIRRARAGDPPPTKVLWSKSRSFRLPVTLMSKDPKRVREMILYISDDGRFTWKKGPKTTPDSPEFPVRVARDGEYWFAVQTMDVDGKLYPNGDKEIVPSMRVIVDSTKPIVTLEPTTRRGSVAGVRWEVQDEHLVLSSLTLEYQTEGARDWRRVPLETADYKVINIKNWDAGNADTIRARLTVKDQAGNSQTVEQVLPDGIAANPGPITTDLRRSTPPQITPIAARPTPSLEDDPFETPSATVPSTKAANDVVETLPSDRDFEPSTAPTSRAGEASAGATGGPMPVKSPKFSLKYDVQDAGPTGPALVELWITRDGGTTWSRHSEDADKKSPINVDLGGDGIYGLWLVVQSASKLGDEPPRPGDRPQSMVEVDSTPPAVTIDVPKVGKKGPNLGKVLITWTATDAHLGPRPISLFYRDEKPESPWIMIADGLPNDGRYIWSAPTTVPPKFHIKVEARDTFGKCGISDTQDYGPVMLDRSRPRGRIIGLDVDDSGSAQK